VDVGAGGADDQRPLELAHVLGVDAEIGLQWHVDADSRRNVDERSTRPDRRVQRGELVVVVRDDRPEVLLDQLRVLAQTRIHVEEEDTLLLEILPQRVVDDFTLVLRTDAGEELPLRLRNAELLEGVLDVLGNLFPRFALLFGRSDVIEDVVKIHPGEIRAPVRHRSLLEMVQGLEPKIAHPVRFILHRRNFFDGGSGQPSAALEDIVFLVAKAVLILADVNLWCSDHCLVSPSIGLNTRPSLTDARLSDTGAQSFVTSRLQARVQAPDHRFR
jgi:hypothetical protein